MTDTDKLRVGVCWTYRGMTLYQCSSEYLMNFPTGELTAHEITDHDAWHEDVRVIGYLPVEYTS